jgi:DNA-binding transcriptional ArsR family regulator
MNPNDTIPTVIAMVKGRQADSDRRRDRVNKALADTVGAGEEISVSGIAARAGVDRTFLYRHRDLLEQVHAAEARPRGTTATGPVVSRASLQADLLAAQQRYGRVAARTQQLEKRLSELLGEQAWTASGLGATSDVEELQRTIVFLEQQVVDLRLQLEPTRPGTCRRARRKPRADRPDQRHPPRRIARIACLPAPHVLHTISSQHQPRSLIR